MKFLRRILDVCTSFAAYRQLANASPWATFGHLVVMLFFCAIVVVASYLPMTLAAADKFAQWWEQSMPAMKIADGKLVTNIEDPSRHHYGNLTIIVDPKGTMDQAFTNSLYGVWIRESLVTYWARNTQYPDDEPMYREEKLSRFWQGPIDGDYIRIWMRQFIWFFAPFAVVGLTIIALLAIVFQAWIFSLASSVLDRSLGRNLELMQYINISLYAAIPAMIVVTAYTAMKLQALMNHIFWVYLIIYGIFLLGGANACRRDLGMGPRD